MNGKYETRVGIFTLGAMLLLLYGWGWLKSFSPFDPPVVFWARFHDVAGLSNNATVNIQGVRVGTVDTISFKLPDGLKDAPDRDAASAKLPKVYTRIRITNHKMPIPKNADITIQTLGMVGAKYIEITLPEDTFENPVDPIDPNVVALGQDPVRVEMVVNNVAKKLNRAADAVSSDEAASALKDIAQAASKLNKTMDKMPALADSMKKASDNVASTSARFGKTAEKSELIADNANRFFREGTGTLSSVHNLSDNLVRTNAKVSKILDNPHLTSDIKETVELAHKTAQTISQTVSEINSSVKDKEIRADLITILGKIQNSSEDIRESLGVVNKLSENGQLRDDIKVVVKDAKDAMTKAQELVSDPKFGTDLKTTMTKVQTAATGVDEAALRLNQILSKRAPLVQMLFGRPGALKADDSNQDKKTGQRTKDGTALNAAGGYH